jgi:hypothetical protein
MDMRSRISLVAATVALTVAATIAPTVAVAPAATSSHPRTDGCVAPRLVGLTERAAVDATHTAGCVVQLAGAALKQATIQTIAVQAPAAGTRTTVVRLTLNPLCFGSALAGPPRNEGMRRGRTELITGVYLVGGPVLAYSSPGCKRKPGTAAKPGAGRIDVFAAGGGAPIASRTAERGRLVIFRLPPGHYHVSGHAQHGPEIFARPFTIRAGYTTRRYVIEPVP